MKQTRSLILMNILLATVFLVHQTAGKCNACGDNGIACISETSFYLCNNNVMQTGTNYTCPQGKICSDLAVKCAPSSGTPACAEAICGCSADKLFTCTSRTTFAQCNGTEIIQTGTCPSGLTCDSQQAGICVDECKLGDKVECDREAPAVNNIH